MAVNTLMYGRMIYFCLSLNGDIINLRCDSRLKEL